MIFKIETVTDELVESAYREGMKELNDFWGINWIECTPSIIVVEDRKQLDELKGTKTENWLVGSAFGYKGIRGVAVLKYKNINVESIQKFDEVGYKALIKHELCHLFYNSVSNGVTGPSWLCEGMSIYLSGQTNLKIWKKPEKFDGFLESSWENMRKAYGEGGFVVELLVRKFGKDKIIQLVKSLSEIEPEKFGEKFAEIYGFHLSYEKVNELYLGNNQTY